MIPMVALAVLQVVVGIALSPYLTRHVAGFGAADSFVIATALALSVWATGWLGTAVLKGVAPPRPAALTAALLGALGVMALTKTAMFSKVLTGPLSGVPMLGYVLAGAVAGYAIASWRR